MSPLNWMLAGIAYALWLAVGVVLTFTIVRLLQGKQSVSGYLKSAPRWQIALLYLAVGFVLGFVTGHWWPVTGG